MNKEENNQEKISGQFTVPMEQIRAYILGESSGIFATPMSALAIAIYEASLKNMQYFEQEKGINSSD